MAKKVSMVIATLLIILPGVIFLNQNSGIESLSLDEISKSRDFFCEESLNETLAWSGPVPIKKIQNAELGGALLQKRLFAGNRFFCEYKYQYYLISTYQGDVYAITEFAGVPGFQLLLISDLYEKYGEPEYIGYFGNDYYPKNLRSLIWEDEGVTITVELSRGDRDSEKKGCFYKTYGYIPRYTTYFDPNSDYIDFPIIVGSVLFHKSKSFLMLIGEGFIRDPFTAVNFADSWEEEICEQ